MGEEAGGECAVYTALQGALYTTVRYMAVQWSSVQCIAVQYSAVCDTVCAMWDISGQVDRATPAAHYNSTSHITHHTGVDSTLYRQG